MARTKYEQPREGVSMTRETGGKDAPAGLYRHPESGETAIVQEDPLFGNAQAQGFLRLGFKFEREVEPGEVKSLPELAANASTADKERVSGLAARLDVLEQSNADTSAKLESVNSDNEKLAEENAKLRKDLEAAQKAAEKAEKADAKTAKADAKSAAADKAHVESADTSTDEAAQSGNVAKGDAARVTEARGEGEVQTSPAKNGGVNMTEGSDSKSSKTEGK